jgi:hypothetical protein
MTTSVLTQKQQTLVKPDEDLMFDREGFDRRQIRMEYAPVNAIDPSTKFVENGDAMFVTPESDYPEGPTSEGEVLGNIDLVRVTGDTQEIPRYTHGFTLDTEETEVSNAHVAEMRDGIMELFGIQADYAFLQGLDREDGTNVFKGVFEWLQDEMPSGNIINGADYDPSAGELQGVPANIVKQIALRKVTGEYIDGQWDIAAAKHPIWADWNQLGTFDGATVESQWEMIRAEDEQDVGVRRKNRVPNEIGLRGPAGVGDLQLAIDFPARSNSTYSSPLGTSDYPDYEASDDAMWLIPQHNGDFYELYEQGSPDHRMLEKEGWKERHEYKWRAGVVQGQTHKRDTDIAVDAVKIENVTALFDSA